MQLGRWFKLFLVIFVLVAPFIVGGVLLYRKSKSLDALQKKTHLQTITAPVQTVLKTEPQRVALPQHEGEPVVETLQTDIPPSDTPSDTPSEPKLLLDDIPMFTPIHHLVEM